MARKKLQISLPKNYLKYPTRPLREFYAASCNPTGGIHRFSVTKRGKLSHRSFTTCDRPMYMAKNDNKLFVLLRCPEENMGNMTSFLAEYNISKNGSLATASSPVSTQGCIACYLSIIDDEVYIANYSSGNVVKMPDSVIAHHGSGPNQPRQNTAHTHFVGVTPDKKFLTVADLGLDTVSLYNRDLTHHASAKVPSGHGARHLMFSECGKYLFSVNELGSSLTAFSYDGNSLSFIDSISTLPTDYSGENTAAAIRLHNGKIYVSNRGHNSIAKLSFNEEKLTFEASYPCGGKSPRDFDFIEEFIICANQNSNTVDILSPKYDKSGEICGYKHTDSYSVPAPLCVVIR